MNYWDYLEAGFKVFGLLGKYDNDGDELPQGQRFKKPVASNWQHTPDWSDEQIECMEESGQLDTGWGVLCNGYLVVDVDPRNGGDESYKQLCSDLKVDLSKHSGFVVRTGGGGLHVYFKLEKDTPLQSHLHKYKGIDFKSSGFVVGCGSLHESGLEYESDKGHPCDVGAPPLCLLDILKKPDTYRAKTSLGTIDVSLDDVKEILAHISPDCDYETWIRCGMAIHHSINGDGLCVFDDWSSNGKTYPGYAQIERHWHSFGKSENPVSLGTLIHYAEENGYQQAVTFDSDFTHEPDIQNITVDLKRPPGLVGDVTDYINSQCLYPRESLSVAAALQAVGNIAGLKFVDSKDDMTANLISFCVAGSSTGKEAVQQAFNNCMKAAGLSGAMHGSIKSEQEIIRNLITHQACFYSIDELGIVLKKILNASSRGGASYLEGVIGLIMSAFSKANGNLLVGGDTKKAIIEELQKEIAISRKKVEENEDPNGRYERRLEQLTSALTKIDEGLEKPFLSLIGYTTPVTFNDLINYEMSTNGFMSRALIFDEPETNPKRKKGFSKQPMSDMLKMRLAAVYNGGESDTGGRIEHYGDKTKIGTSKDAVAMLDDVYEYFWQLSEDAKEHGLEAIPRRGYEMTSKVSFILAIGDGLRTTEHVEWAFELAKKDIDRKMKLSHSNISSEESPSDAIAIKIQSILESYDEPLTEGVLINKCRPHKKEDSKKILNALVDKQFVDRFESTNGRNRKFTYYRLLS